MSDNPNGVHNPLPFLAGAAPQQVSVDRAIAILEQTIGPAVTIILKGVQAGFPNLPPPLVMLAACRVLGRLVGGTFAGHNAPLAPLLKARSDCLAMFEKSLREVPVNSAYGGAPAMPPPNENGPVG